MNKAQRIEMLSELAFSMGLSDQLIDKTLPGRLRNLLLKLQSATITEARKMKKVPNSERDAAAKRVLRFAELTKWEGKPLHICTKVNFMLALYDRSPYGAKLIPILNEIYDYFARVKDAPKACEWAASLAYDKWEQVRKEIPATMAD